MSLWLANIPERNIGRRMKNITEEERIARQNSPHPELDTMPYIELMRDEAEAAASPRRREELKGLRERYGYDCWCLNIDDDVEKRLGKGWKTRPCEQWFIDHYGAFGFVSCYKEVSGS